MMKIIITLLKVIFPQNPVKLRHWQLKNFDLSRRDAASVKISALVFDFLSALLRTILLCSDEGSPRTEFDRNWKWGRLAGPCVRWDTNRIIWYIYVRAYNYGILFRINFRQTHYKVSIDIGSQSIDRWKFSQ